eukprot:EG_transcript_1657
MADLTFSGIQNSIELRPASFLGDVEDGPDPPDRLWRRVCVAVCESADLAEEVIEATASSVSRSAGMAGVSGVFLFSKPIVLQVTEYDPMDVSAGRCCDMRLRDGVVLCDAPCTHRLFTGLTVRVLQPAGDPGLHFLVQRLAAVPAVLQHIPQQVTQLLVEGRDPLQEPWRAMDVTVAFVKLAEYESITQHPVMSQHIGLLADRLVSVCTGVAKARGGFVMKTIHGMCMLYWPDGDTSQAVAAICQCVEDLETYRQGQLCHAPGSLLHAFAGVHYGSAVLANVGGRLCDFTLLGDTINVAARLSCLAKEVGAAVLVSGAVRQQLPSHMARLLVDTGSRMVKGRSEPVRCYRAMECAVDLSALGSAMDRIAPHSPELARPDHGPFVPWEVQDFPSVGEPGADDPAWPETSFGPVPLQPLQPGTPEELYRVTYVAHAGCPSFRYTLPALRRSAGRANRRRGITACLLYVDGLILQTIEGPQPAVLALWGRIRADPRHRDVVALRMAKCTNRTTRSPFDALTIAEQDRVLARVVMGQLALSTWALDRYVPTCQRRLVLQGLDLRRMPPVTADAVLLASDLCGYTTLCEASALSEVARLCTEFLALCDTAITEQGGEVLKIVGDAVLARFAAAAPECAVAAAQTIVVRCAALRKRCGEAARESTRSPMASRDCRALALCGVGLDYGPVTMTYSGCAGLTEMTLLGPPSTRVMEVERLTRQTGRAVLLTAALVDILPPSSCPLVSLSRTHDVGGQQLFGLMGTKWDLPISSMSRQQALFSKERQLSDVTDSQDAEVLPAIATGPVVRPALFYDEQAEAFGQRDTPDDESVTELTNIKTHTADRMHPPPAKPAARAARPLLSGALAALCRGSSPARVFKEAHPASKKSAPRSLWCCLWPRGGVASE